MRRISHPWSFILVLAALLAPAVAQASILGDWTLEMSGTLEGEEVPCVFRGTASLAAVVPQGDFAYSGPGHLDLISGPQGCAPSLDGILSVNVKPSAGGLEVSGQIDGGEALGLGDFTGLVVGDPMASGTFSVTSGPFAGFAGAWNGSLAGGVLAIPTLRTAGLVVLAALLAAVSLLVLRRRAA